MTSIGKIPNSFSILVDLTESAHFKDDELQNLETTLSSLNSNSTIQTEKHSHDSGLMRSNGYAHLKIPYCHDLPDVDITKYGGLSNLYAMGPKMTENYFEVKHYSYRFLEGSCGKTCGELFRVRKAYNFALCISC